jgi:DNA-binding winged helix-turn-helix (wHTH) protein
MRAAHGTHRFGPFRLDADARQLFRDGTRVYLQDRCFDVLALLVANPGDILSQDDLTKAVWTDYNVTDNSIVQTVGVLRDVLAGRLPIVSTCRSGSVAVTFAKPG